MTAILAKLVGAALFVASFGRPAAALLLGAGVVVLVLGKRAFRPGAGVVGAGAAALGVHLALLAFDPHHALPPALTLAGAAVLGAALGVAAPRVTTILAGTTGAFAATPFVGRPLGLDRDLVVLGTTLFGAIVPIAFWHALPLVVPPLAGAAVATLGAWALVGATGLSPALFHLPVAWVAVFGVLVVVGAALARASQIRGEARKQVRAQRAKADEAKRRAADERARYARFLD